MAAFQYKAHTADGKLHSGAAEAASEEELLHQLRTQGLYCFEIKEEQGRSVQPTPLRLKELTNFCRQLSSLLNAGINMSRALDTLYQSNTSRRVRAAALSLYESVLRGRSLSQSMKQLGPAFPELLIYMTETGEASGTLEAILEEMADHYEQELQLKKKAQSALIYPCILAVVSVAVVIFMLVSVLPKFISMYDGVALPLPTRALLALSGFLQTKWAWILGALLALALAVGWMMEQKPVRIAVKQMQLRLPVVGRLLRTILTSRFASTFAVLYSSGIGILQSVDILSRVMDNDYVEQQLQGVKSELQDGQMLSAALEKTGVFDQILITMISVGEESGTLDTMLKKTGRNFQRDAETALVRLVALIEPVMIVALGAIIAFIVLAIITPVFSMYQQIL